MQLLLKMTVKVAGYFTVFLPSSTREHDQSPIPKLIVLRLFFRKYLVSFRNCSSETMSHYFAVLPLAETMLRSSETMGGWGVGWQFGWAH